ncbi:MAG: hypothetical protein A2249_02195 [Candidatus Jacksonbacteria bacterium RIFOXYA2_FULL_44_7]|uniref:Ligand-binding protein SH3 n=1 Tax=Candidatus Jacksonbacteria bacterium RIFCSPLOWO2_02_FULL_44_20 TaxID=1798460 RepID=A0A1G2A948_9BACT|nr:MAG: hypothetical protein UW39_C0010G0008 [Parcubacteria group bacterium GW2011_GWC2_44_17]KKT48382.1 MAG: hypothetical protein UW40_C0045G0001 [Parcubacteria group bacterium GW2011_GWF2_44_17]OGY69594.1 MAG: hypothetical protein A3C00_02195 [Candidatus Jacksonbacteria bacterium RIFCSPHIGHO2_02_FULL_44_25]OGY71975.1 MAG: hypothetical protein A3E05_01990 [Candidatus Jacksonbacteria bacterium RIFCSPHIGHO2_12_FULL_44_12]OGY73428.1 MAG: hypothetical protein A3H61_04735 [Candidatus Jacksonbacteri
MNETFLKIFLLSMAPVGELNAGIPYGIFKGANPLLAYGAAIFGNMIPPAFLLLLLPGFEKLFGIGALPEIKTHHKLLDKPIALYLWWRKKTEHGISKKIEGWGVAALILYIAIPGPFTGAWSASLAAYLFGIPYRKALFAIFIGVVLAGAIITLMSIGLFTSYETYTFNYRLFSR